MNKRPAQNASIATTLQHALAAHQAGDLAQAEELYMRILTVDKKQFDALHMLAILNAQRGNFDHSERFFRRATEIKPDHGPCHYNRGNVLIELKKYEKAIACYDKAVALAPTYIEAHFNRGNALFKIGRFEDALRSFDAALRLNGNVAELHSSKGNALGELKRFGAALECFDKAILLRPDNAEFYANRGNALHKLGRLDEALASFDKALSISPNNAEFHYNRGNVLRKDGRAEKALASFGNALAINPNDAEVLHNRGSVFNELGRFADALADYEKAHAIDPALNYLEGARLHAKMHLCLWNNLAAECAALLANIRKGARASLPFPVLAMNSTPADQLRCAQIYTDDRFPSSPHAGKSRPSHDRIRIAYLSSDFHDHAMAQLSAGLFEQHNRSCFEPIAISFGLDDRSAMRARLQKAFDRFVDVSNKSTAQIAGLIEDMGVDIAIDLNGHTRGARTGIVALRPAPLQVNFNYPGTTGAPYIDYILADKIVIPENERRNYSEQVVYLPHSYQQNDDKRPIAEKTVTRAQSGLPERGLVFCSFNNNYKFTPDVFSIWMRLLQQVEGSVLWLLEGNASAPDNLRAEAARRGVGPERIVFAPKMPVEDHLARHRLADLFLDTLPYNAHTTASDALWAGLPVLTCRGTTFAGRVAASLLTAVGLPDLITESLADYEALALRLAREPDFLAALRANLAANRAGCALFDTARFTRHVEAAYSRMWERHRRGEPPAAFAVDA
jgi:protein O-GlcNAc transferase